MRYECRGGAPRPPLKVVEVDVGRALSPSGLPDLDYALNPYLGCYHGCLYCYARVYTRHREVAERWGELVAAKRNLVALLVKEVKRIRRGTVGFGTITDPYQPAEALYRLTRSALEVLAVTGLRVSVQTKSSLVLRDLDLLKELGGRADVGITVTSLSNSSPMAKVLEPRAPPPSARVEALRRLSSAGLRTWVFYGPVVPGYNDGREDIEGIVELARETESTLYVDKLRVKAFMFKHPLLAALANNALRYDWGAFFRVLMEECKREGVVCRPGFEYEGSEGWATLDHFLSNPTRTR